MDSDKIEPIAFFGDWGRLNLDTQTEATKIKISGRQEFTLENLGQKRFIYGEIERKDSVHAVLKGCRSVVFVSHSIGMLKPLFKEGWSDDGIDNVISVMSELKIRRLILLTDFCARTPGEIHNESANLASVRKLYSPFKCQLFEQWEREIELVYDSKLNWTIIRVPELKYDDSRFGKLAGIAPPASSFVGQRFLEHYLENELHDGKWMLQAPYFVPDNDRTWQSQTPPWQKIDPRPWRK